MLVTARTGHALKCFFKNKLNHNDSFVSQAFSCSTKAKSFASNQGYFLSSSEEVEKWELMQIHEAKERNLPYSKLS